LLIYWGCSHNFSLNKFSNIFNAWSLGVQFNSHCDLRDSIGDKNLINYCWCVRHPRCKLNSSQFFQHFLIFFSKMSQKETLNFLLNSQTFVSFRSICWNILEISLEDLLYLTVEMQRKYIFWGKQAGWIFLYPKEKERINNGIKCELYKSLRFLTKLL